MRSIHKVFPGLINQRSHKLLGVLVGLLLFQATASGQTFQFPSLLYVDSISLHDVVATAGPDTVTVTQGDYSNMTNAIAGSSGGSSFILKSITALTNFKVNVKSPDAAVKDSFTYLITYKTIGTPNPSSSLRDSSNVDTLSVSYHRDSLRLISDRAFNVAGKYHRLKIIIYDVFELTNPSTPPVLLTPNDSASVPPFVHIYGEIYVQKFISSAASISALSKVDSIASSGIVRLSWTTTPADVKPAAYEVEWTYVPPGNAVYDFRNNATRIFTNSTYFRIPVAQKEGAIVYRVRMVRPSLADLLSRTYSAWTLTTDQGSLSGVSNHSVNIPGTSNDSLNWDLKMSFVEDGKYKQVVTYYDGLFKPKQVQTRFNSKPKQTIVAQSLFDHEGRVVINSLPIPVHGVSKFAYISNFLHPAGEMHYPKMWYDSLPNPAVCPAKELPIPPLDPNAQSNEYYSTNNPDKQWKNAFIPDAEGYPLTRKIIAAENSEKVLFEGQAGAALQLGNDRQTAYLYGSPLQSELNKYFGQDIGKYNYYRKMITSDNHQQDMFSITDDEGKLVATGLIGTPDTNSLALSVRNSPVNDSFKSNLMPIPNIRLDENWMNNGSYFVERTANYSFQYQIDYKPFKPCPGINKGLLPKIYYMYEVLDDCGNIKLQDSGALGGIGMTSHSSISHAHSASTYLNKGNHVWTKHSYLKLEDLTSSVNVFLDSTDGCFLTFNDFLREEFIKAKFPCDNSDDPCSAMKLVMMKEMYPRAKYGMYSYTDSASKAFAGPADNSIFSMISSSYRYQMECFTFPDTLFLPGAKYYNIQNLPPQTLIDIFNDTLAEALLPLHPDYCKLQFCELINNPYAKQLGYIKKASQAIASSRYTLTDIVNNDPLKDTFLTAAELSKTIGDEASIDSIAFRKTICGSEIGAIESTCGHISAASPANSIANYPEVIRDEYYRNLIALYTANREERLSEKLRLFSDTCNPCLTMRLQDIDTSTLFGAEDDTTFMVSGIDSTTTHLNLPVNSSFSNLFIPSATVNADSLNNLTNLDNSIYCKQMVEYVINSLSNCNVLQSQLDALEDSLLSSYCSNNSRITSLSYESLTTVMEDMGIPIDDLCNAGLADLRKITRRSGDFVQLGLLHYAPKYYEDLSNFLQTNQLLNFIAGSANTVGAVLPLSDGYPFQQNLAVQLGGTPCSSCSTTLAIGIFKTNMTNANSVRLSFVNTATSDTVNYYLYPTTDTGRNALNNAFGASPISGTTDYQLRSLFNLYGFDNLSKSFANRNSIVFHFKGAQDGVQRQFSYFLSAFNEQSDYNMMERDQEENLNGLGCSEFLPMAEDVITMASQLNIKVGHPHFERYFTNVLNYKNSVNFDYNNFNTAIQSCGVTDSIIIPKNIAHFRIKFPSGATMTTIGNFIDTLLFGVNPNPNIVGKGVGISDIKSYQLNGSKYLLLDIFEADTNLSAAKQIIQSLAGSAVVEYMPYLHKDTVAELLSSNFDPINLSALAAAFPGATISSDSVDVFYFIPGYGSFSSRGNYIQVQKSITTNYDYNHYVDSICRYVNSNAPTTYIFTHAESAVSTQYDNWQMVAWRNYVRSITSQNHNELVKQSKAPKFNLLSASNGSNSFATSRFSYVNARRPHYLNTLYIDHDPNGNSNFNYLNQLLQDLETYNSGTIFTPHPTQSPVNNLVVNGTETRSYVCGDTTQFWINHFDTNRYMMNVFIKLPDYLPLPRLAYGIHSISKGFEKDSITYLNLVLTANNGSTIYDTIECIAYANMNLGSTYTIPSAFLSSHRQFETLSDKFQNCETRTIEHLYPAARINYALYADSIRNALVIQFRQHVIDSLEEQLSIMGNDIKHGVTLYYYDMAGNLIKTVSPAGVDKLSVLGADNDTINAHRLRNEKVSPLVPSHTKATSYAYNAQNKVVEATTPDGGATISQYDRAGRVVVSQDAKQALTKSYTYFLYDNLSRVIETGVVVNPNGWAPDISTGPGTVTTSTIKSKYRTEVTVTIYDTASYLTSVSPFQTLPLQENLKNRVACTKYFEAVAQNADASKDTSYTNALHYSYDISGNVKTLIYDLRTLMHPLLRVKRVDYEYDLYSGKVMLVSYNRGRADQFYQKYSYDSDNRITEVHTSNNGIMWDRDASYEYYDHGPLARTELGEQRVQGVDYAYTINGWLKAINGFQNNSLSDMGEDGTIGGVMPGDVFSQRIDYFLGDYKAIADSAFFNHLTPTPKSLYNGNIAGVAKALRPFDNIYAKYHYDPLQRIDRAEYSDYSYSYTTSTLTSASIPDYASAYKYDPDGNLLELNRQGGTVSAAMNGGTAIAQHKMDSLTYRYMPGTNRLVNIQDSSSSTAYKIDLPPTMGDTALALYDYDPTGNMTKDLVSGLTKVQWNRFGKVKSIQKTDGTSIQFTYDPMGNRLAKEVVTYPGTDTMLKQKTVYVRDASGNSLAVYENKKEFDLAKLTPTAVAGSPGIGFPGGLLPAAFANAVASHLISSYDSNPNNNLAKLAMTVPDLDGYSDGPTLMQGLVSSLSQAQVLSFVKSEPAITEYTLGANADDLEAYELSHYLQPIMLSQEMDGLLTQLFLALKTYDIDLYYTTIENVPADEWEKSDFPEDLGLLDDFKGMEAGERLVIVNGLAEALRGRAAETYPIIADVLMAAYTNDNTYADFVSEVPDADNIFDQLEADANTYIAYRYALADMEEVPFDTVKNQFKYNTVLAGALADQIVVPTTEGVATVLGDHFDDVMTMAQNEGKSADLVVALKKGIGDIGIDVLPESWLKTQEILQSDKVHLAEHHLYGSSRLGMQKYLPGELKFEYTIDPGANVYQGLTQSKPWYSLYGNDLFASTVYNNTLSTTTMGTTGMGINTHILGNRHYELTNHLGNVQATVVDRTTPVVNPTDGELEGYNADISTAQDYYPFGMYMPGRYLSDTDRHCVTVNSTIMVAKPVKLIAAKAQTAGLAYQVGADPAPPEIGNLPKATAFEDEVLHVYHYNSADLHPNGWVIHTDAAEGTVQYEIDLSDEPGEIHAYFQIHADTNQEVQPFGFNIELADGVYADMRVRQYYEGEEGYYELTEWTEMTIGDHEVLLPINKSAVAAGGNTILEILFKSHDTQPFANGLKAILHNPYTFKTQMVPTNFVTTICDDEDDYRFGFNGKEKDNEVKGIGNSIDFGSRMHDARLGRWLSVDPLAGKYPGQSPYDFALNTPIQAIDPDGKIVVFVNGFMLDQWKHSDNRRYKDFDPDPKHAQMGINPNYRPYPTNEMSTKGPTYLGKQFSYWGNVDRNFKNALNDQNALYVSGSNRRTSQAIDRFNAGMKSGNEMVQKIVSGEIKLSDNETIKIVSHSQGAAHAAGMGAALQNAYNTGIIKNKVEQIFYLAPHQPTDINSPSGVFSIQYSRMSDKVSSVGPVSTGIISGGSEYGEIQGVSEMVQMPDMDTDRGGHNVETFEGVTNIPKNSRGGVSPTAPTQPRR